MRQGIITTFYSYKGGVGRSFALANIAAILVRWRFRVLCIDWDIEAPGLDYYFLPYAYPVTPRPGLVDMLSAFAAKPKGRLDWQSHTTGVEMRNVGTLDLIRAGTKDADYGARVQELDWAHMYERGLGEALDRMCAEMREAYDFVLIDGRTGITDFGGIFTAQLPDILAFLFTANEQSLEGATEVAEKAVQVRNSLPFDQARLLLLPIPARFDANVEYETAQHWKTRYVERVGHLYDFWAVQGTEARTLIDYTTIPYVPYWSFGERLSAIEEPTPGPSAITYSLETIAALIVHRLGRTDLLRENRDSFVNAARRLGSRRKEGVAAVFLSYSHRDRDIARVLSNALHERGITVVSDIDVPLGEVTSDWLEEQINRAQHMIVLVGSGSASGQWMDREIRTFQFQSASEESRVRFLLPILLPGASSRDMPKQLMNLKHLSIADTSIEAVVDEIGKIVATEPPAIA